MERINVHVTKQQIEKLEAEVKKSGLQRAEIIRRAIDKYLEER